MPKAFVEAFLEEISAEEREASFEAVKEAIKKELLLPPLGLFDLFRGFQHDVLGS